MSVRKENLVQGEYYHIYNRGVDKRTIFLDEIDLNRFLKIMKEFNTINPIGSLYLNNFNKKEEELRGKTSQLVNFIAFCLNPNHYHFLITPLVEKGIEKFMQRSGSLFEGKFKSKHISSNDYLLHLSAYINLNNCDQNGKIKHSLSKSSWKEYVDSSNLNLCDKTIILGQFKSKDDYKKFAINSWKETCMKKEEIKKFEFE
jgi:REP element-mobilizing transposase RayT